MPAFRVDGKLIYCSMVTGPSHAELGLELHGTPIEMPSVVRIDRGRCESCLAPEESVVIRSVSEGLAHAAEKTGRRMHAHQIVYFADDSNRPDMYMWLSNLIAVEANRLGL